MAVTEKLHLELGTCPLLNSYESRSTHHFLLEVRDELWCEMWPSWVSEENVVVTRAFIIVSVIVGITVTATMTRKSFYALYPVRLQQVATTLINASFLVSITIWWSHGLACMTGCRESQKKQKSLSLESWSQSNCLLERQLRLIKLLVICDSSVYFWLLSWLKATSNFGVFLWWFLGGYEYNETLVILWEKYSQLKPLNFFLWGLFFISWILCCS